MIQYVIAQRLARILTILRRVATVFISYIVVR